MSGASSSAAAWFTRLEPVRPSDDLPRRADDPRLGDVIACWDGDPAALAPGRAVLIGFPQDEGVRRNLGRPGAAEAPAAMRHWLYRLTPWDAATDTDLSLSPPLDAGDIRITGDLEAAQAALGEVVAGILQSDAVPVVLGGGHETAFGHYLGYAAAGRDVSVINLDAHLDIRPLLDGRGHSGSPFRQMMEHPTHPLPGSRYICLGAQPYAVSHDHLQFVRDRGGQVAWNAEVAGRLGQCFAEACEQRGQVYVTLDADVVQAADVPGVSAPNALGLCGREVADCARRAGRSPHVSSFDLVEINPRHDSDGRSARWAALVVWNFLTGLAARARS